MDDPDLENREPCPDGRCVGVIGPDGRCGVCGQGRDTAANPEATDRVAPAEVEAPGPPSAAEAESPADAIDPDARILCWDDRCVGIIGGDGRCGTCGRANPPSPL